jgi:hypothetical protein
MIEFFPYILVVCMFIFIIYRDEVHRAERRDLLRMVKARDLDEVVRAEKEDKKTEPDEVVLPDFTPTEALTDDEFMDTVTGEAGK